jgi:hypothetical protein
MKGNWRRHKHHQQQLIGGHQLGAAARVGRYRAVRAAAPRGCWIVVLHVVYAAHRITADDLEIATRGVKIESSVQRSLAAGRDRRSRWPWRVRAAAVIRWRNSSLL